MQFAQNDKTIAEDLLQETFLRFSQVNLEVEDIRDVEALLYTYLEHVYLAHLREVKRHSFISLADAKLDALALGLLTGPDVDRIETQNVLRRIAAYVAWRKHTSKSASIVALRFFHGYLPEEIACIALVSREAIDERLHNGRNEVRLHLLDSGKLREIQHGGPIEIFPSKVVVPADQFLMELRNELFRESSDACMPEEQLIARYRKNADLPIRRDQLAHIVSCSKCLAIVDKVCRRGGNLRGSGGSGGPLEMNHRNSHRDGSLSSTRHIERVVRRAERRMKEIFEHRPTSLIVAVNGVVLASRDVRASFNALKVETLAHDLKFIEILNEYGVSLFSWAVESIPPHSDPVLHREVQFCMGRGLEVDLRFSAQRLIIEVRYHDPSYRESSVPSFAALANIQDDEDAEGEQVVGPNAAALFPRHDLLPRWTIFRWTPLAFAGIVCALIVSLNFILGLQNIRTVKPAEFLSRAAASDKQDIQKAESNVIIQRVTIRSAQSYFQRSIYRDPKGKRRMKEQGADEKKVRLKSRLAEAGINWDAPLSILSFQDWESHTRIKSESVHSVSDRFLMLRVDTEGGDVEQETITIRTSDYHPIGRTAEFRDFGTVEIAELSYAVVPWANINQSLLVNDRDNIGSLSAAPHLIHLPQSPPPVSDVELDLAELQVRTVLHDLHADSTDRLTISRTSHGVEVRGLLDDDQQKLELQHQLHLISHVSANLSTVTDASSRDHADPAPASVQVASMVAEPSLLEVFLLREGRSRKYAGDLTGRFFAVSNAILRASKDLARLQERFARSRLTPKAHSLYDRLRSSKFEEMETALREEREAVLQTGVQIRPEEVARSGPTDMNADLERNRALLSELIGHDAPDTRTAPVVLADLARSAAALQRTVSEEHAKVFSGISSNTPSASNIHP